VTLEPQPFEAEFLGGPCFRLAIPPEADAEIVGREIVGVLARAKASGARLVMARLPAGRTDPIGVLQHAGFHRIETLITFERALIDAEPLDMDNSVRLAQPRDFDACIEIARSAFQADRFHADARIPTQAADALKARWVANDLGGRADASFVASDAGRPVGFNLCLKRNGVAIIDLIALAPAHRGRGLGAALVAASLAHYAGRTRMIQVGTQANNTASIATYRRFGFHPVTEAATLHWMP
jgi:ribosomal protein S18 acetylase RimI-like enzyme